jgi:hypothetical protein
VVNPQRLFGLLQQEEVEAVLVGGVAMIAQRVPHDTNDIDLCYSHDPDNLARLVRALTPLHPRKRGLTDRQPEIVVLSAVQPAFPGTPTIPDGTSTGR